VIVLDEALAEDDMPRLYRTADAFVLPTRGEGWGLPIMEAMASALPVLVTNWGAHLDFANDDNAYLIRSDGTVPVDEEQRRQSPFYGPDHRWANPSVEHLASVMRHVFEHRAEARDRGLRARDSIGASWTPQRTARWTVERLAHLAPDPSVAMEAGRRAEREGRLEDAEQRYATAAAGRPGWMLPVYNRASILKRQGQRESARPLFEDVASRGETPDQRGGAWFHTGQLAFEDGDLPTAAVAFDNCLVELPSHARARAWRAFVNGRMMEQAGDLEKARDAYRAAHDHAADWKLPTYALASALTRLGHADDARTLFAEVCRTATEAALRGGAHFHIAEILAARTRYPEAVGHLESCLLEMPKHTAAAQLLTMLRIRSSSNDRERTVA
jgi:tetratricopeptide (TPR) repeat protein